MTSPPPRRHEASGMSTPFSEALRRRLAAACQAFPRLAEPAGSAGLKRAAVAVVLLPMGDDADSAAFLLTRRATGLRGHSGQWALPGGRCEEGETAAAAALRELGEEVGLELGAQDVLGLLDDYPTRSGYLITPVVVWAGVPGQLSLDPSEVAAVYRIPLAELVDGDAADFSAIPESDRRLIRLRINGGWLHAPTAAVLYQFAELVKGRVTRVSDLEQPVFAWR